MDIMELLKDILQMVIYAIITGCGVMLIKSIMDYINNKIDEVQATTKLANHEKINRIIDQVQGIVYNIVVSINQVMVESLKSEGKFDKESAEIAKETAIDKAKELLSDEAIKAIEQIYGDVDPYLDVLIESVVNELKKNK